MSPDNKILSPEFIAFLQRHINLHRVIWLLSVIVLFAAWNRGIALMYGLFSLLLAILLLSYVFPFFQLRKLFLALHCKENLQVGESGQLVLTINTTGRRYHLSVALRHPIIELGERVFIDYVDRHCKVLLPVESRMRGVYQITSIQLTLSYPFGIFSVTRSIPVAEQEVLVLPKAAELGVLRDLHITHSVFSGSDSSERKGGQGEFLSLRDWVAGDDIRHVDWKSTARRQQMVIKEFSQEDREEWNIIFNAHSDFVQGEAMNSSLEKTISFILGLIESITASGQQIKLWVCEDALWSMTFEPYHHDFVAVYEAMARLQARSTQSYANIISQLQSIGTLSGRCMTFRLDSDPAVELHGICVTHFDMVFLKNSFVFPLQNARQLAPEITTNGKRYFVGLHTHFRTLLS